MPIIKQKQIRHFALDWCFRNKTKRYYIEVANTDKNQKNAQIIP